MTNRPARRYFDSDVIIRLIENRPEAPTIEALIQEAAAGHWKLVLSAVSMLECTRKPGKPVDPAAYARIISFFENPYIYMRDLDTILAERAVKLIYDYLWLHPKDAAHLASAIDTGCQFFYTYDQELIDRFDKEHGLRVLQPGMAVDTDLSGLPLFGTADPQTDE